MYNMLKIKALLTASLLNSLKNDTSTTRVSDAGLRQDATTTCNRMMALETLQLTECAEMEPLLTIASCIMDNVQQSLILLICKGRVKSSVAYMLSY